jgi:WD40 repeat protein
MKRYANKHCRRINNLPLTTILVTIAVAIGACQAPPMSDDALATEVAATIYAEQAIGTSADASPARATPTPRAPALELLVTSTPQPTPTPSLPCVGTPLPASLNPITPENAGEIEPLALWGRGIINSLSYSPDGSVLAVASSLGVYLYDVETLDALGMFPASPGASNVAFSPDSELMAILLGGNDFGYQSELVRTRDLSSLGVAEESWTEIQQIAFAADGESYFEIGEEVIQIDWNPSGLWSNYRYGLFEYGHNIALSPSGKLVAIGPDWTAGSDDAQVEIVEVASGETRTVIDVYPWEMAFSSNDQWFAVSTHEAIQLWELESSTLYESLEISQFTESSMDETEYLFVDQLVFAADANKLAYTDSEGMLWLWDWRAHEHIQVASSLGSDAQLVFTPAGDGLAVVIGRRVVQILDLPDGGICANLDGFTKAANQIAFSPGSDLVTLEGYNGWIVARNPGDGSLLWHVSPEPNPHLTLSPEADRFLDTYRHSHSRTTVIRIWGLPNGDLQFEFALPSPDTDSHFISLNPEPINFAFSPDGNTLAISASDDVVYLVNAYDQTILGAVDMTTANAASIAISPQNDVIAFGGEDAIIRVCEMPSGNLLHKLARQASGIKSLQYSPDGRTLASVAHDGTVAVWAVDDGELRYVLEPSLPESLDSYVSLTDAVYSPDGRILAAGSRAHDALWLWDVHEGTLLTTVVGSERTWGISSLAFSPDGDALVQGLEDGTIRFWGIP